MNDAERSNSPGSIPLIHPRVVTSSGAWRQSGRRTGNDSGARLCKDHPGRLMYGGLRRQPFTKGRISIDILTSHPEDRRRVGTAGDVIQCIEIAGSLRDADVATWNKGREEH